ncbi:uncharacterized protein [Drosophila virilis]|uniref:Uncharacterized protein n=1 Tax=Drosophila virilis TaxID=7244 RepID=B4LSP9_DROVI|nr:uncharacterized protein LOC6627711 [Drosophila virilis]EDW63788.1 uncharacterized protein Dvir_GJ16613 [Drosophila virilis]
MFFDDEGMPFDPFNIGPNDCKRLDYDVPNTPSYPPPVFASWPPPKKCTHKSVSQSTVVKRELTDGSYSFKTDPSLMGEVEISKAINEEMTASKRPVPAEKRYRFGVRHKRSRASFWSAAQKSMMTVTPVRHHRLAEKSSEFLQASSVRSQTSKDRISCSNAKKRAHAGGNADKKSIASRISSAKDVSQSNIQETKINASNTSSNINKITPSLRDVADSIRKELAQTVKISKALAAKASELSKRLRTGSESPEKVVQRSRITYISG